MKFCDTEHRRFEDTKSIMSPVKFRVFQETGVRGFVKSPYLAWFQGVGVSIID